MAGCGHIVYSWRELENCPNCSPPSYEGESLREWRRRMKHKGLYS